MSDIRLNGKMVSFTRITFQSSNFANLEQEIKTLSTKLTGMPIIIDATLSLPLDQVLTLLRQYHFQPLAVVEGVLADQARAQQFPVLPADPAMQRVAPSASTGNKTPTAPTPAPGFGAKKPVTDPVIGNVMHQEILRTGQRLVAEHGDLVLLADVNSGAELIAAGSIHVYGTARGRLIAGTSPDNNAFIFCQKLEAELVSLSGTFSVAEDIPQDMIGQAVYISLGADGTLQYKPLRSN